MKLTDLVGRDVQRILINADKDILIIYLYSGNPLVIYATFIGSCCARCFIAHVSGCHDFSKIMGIEQSEWTDTPESDKENFEQIARMGIKIRTDRGYIDIETRLEHNGYYDGEILLSEHYPTDQYGDPVNFDGETFSELKDF